MKEKYLEILEKYLPENYLIEDIANELLNLHSVSVGSHSYSGVQGDKYSLDLCQTHSLELIEKLRESGYNTQEDIL